MGNKAKRGIGRSTQRYGGLRRRWRGFIALEPTDRLLFLKLWGQLAIVSVLLRLVVEKHAHWLLTCLIPEKPNYPIRPDQTLSYAQRVGYPTRKADRHLPIRASCLRQPLLVWWFLRRRGLGVKLRIGVNDRKEFLAHAWVELEGRPVNDSPGVTEGFHPFDRIP